MTLTAQFSNSSNITIENLYLLFQQKFELIVNTKNAPDFESRTI